MKGVIRKNERIGKEIEKWAAEQLKGTWVDSQTSPYDVDKPNTLIEVKSCQDKTLDKVAYGRRYYQKGRFVIILSSHQELLNEAATQGKDPAYYFVLYHLNANDVWIPLDVKLLSWKDVNAKIEQRGKSYTRSQGELKLCNFRWDTIFTQQRL